jgi:archaemetzincin
MQRLFIFASFIFTLFFACNGSGTQNTNAKKQPEIEKLARFSVDPLMVDLQPFSDIPDSMVNYVYVNLKKLCPNTILKKPIALPQFAFYKPRNRYKADSLLYFLSRQTEKGHVVLGLTSKDISTTKGKIQDWGVMGLGFCPGNACVISCFRLNKNNLLNQLFKVVIHELGHTQGLDHCNNKSCMMRDAEGKNTTEEEKDFCPKCKAYLVSKGWVFK